MEWKVLAFRLTSVKKTKQRHFRLICDTDHIDPSVAVINLFCSPGHRDPFFPQHVAAADKSSVTGASLNLSPLIVPSFLDLYVNIGEFAA